MLAGSRSFAAISQWAANASEQILDAVGAGPVHQVSRLSGGSCRPSGSRRAIAVDGKTMRGSRGADGAARHLMWAIDHDLGVVLAQVDVAEKTNEIPMFSQLIDHIGSLSDVVVTADAMHAQTVRRLPGPGTRCALLLTVKRNQPTLHEQLKTLPWRDVPVAYQTAERAHGRIEKRSLKIVTVAVRRHQPDPPNKPHPGQPTRAAGLAA